MPAGVARVGPPPVETQTMPLTGHDSGVFVRLSCGFRAGGELRAGKVVGKRGRGVIVAARWPTAQRSVDGHIGFTGWLHRAERTHEAPRGEPQEAKGKVEHVGQLSQTCLADHGEPDRPRHGEDHEDYYWFVHARSQDHPEKRSACLPEPFEYSIMKGW